jgi:hypothetical protein
LDANLTTRVAKAFILGMESNRATEFGAIPDEARQVLATKGEGTEILMHCFKY